MIDFMDKGSIKIHFNKGANFLLGFGFVFLLSSSALLGKSELDRRLEKDNADKKDLAPALLWMTCNFLES